MFLMIVFFSLFSCNRLHWYVEWSVICKENHYYNAHLCLPFVGSVLRCDVTGKILMKCFLSGMPDLKLGLNDKIGLEKESQLKSRPAKR